MGIVVIPDVLIKLCLLCSVGERGHNEESQHDERHALQEPAHQAVPHAEERRGQQTAGGGSPLTSDLSVTVKQ